MTSADTNKDDVYYQALIERSPQYVGVFFVGVRTTGVFCISTCRARKPKRENVTFFTAFKSALDAGFRPCKICRPTENAHAAPDFVEHALSLVRENPKVRVTDWQLREHHISPESLRRWFHKHYGITFQAYQRMLRVNTALQELKGGRSATETAFDSGYDSLSGFGYTFKKLTGSAPRETAQVIVIHRLTTPIGPMFVSATDKGICLLEFVDRRMLETEFHDLQLLLKARIIAGSNEHTRQAEREIAEYFAGTRRQFTLQLDAPGSDFQRSVWQHLQAIGFGETEHYQGLAKRMGKQKAVRAVAGANGANRIAIVIPCHRIIGKNGSMTGYGGGVARKQWLLEHERKMTAG